MEPPPRPNYGTAFAGLPTVKKSDYCHGNCDGTFRGFPNVYFFGAGDAGAGLALADINGDGHLDVVTSGIIFDVGPYGPPTGDAVAVLLGDGHGKLAPGRIYNSNRFTLRGLGEVFGCELRDYGIVPDSLEATRDVLRRAASECDVVVTSGGVSVGEADYVKPAVEAEGEHALGPGDQLVAVFGRLASPAGIEQSFAADLKELNITFITLSHDPASIRVLK